MGNASKERVDLERKVYSKTEYPKIIDTKFSQLGVVSVTNQIENTFTVEQFFLKYNELFYEIPAFGDTNSHEYLIKTSSEYINFDQDNDIIAALQKEIAQLRQDLLKSEIKTAEALTGEKINLNVADSVEELTDFESVQNAFEGQERANPELTTTNPQSVSANTNPGY
jgi:hypothetical protein|tara:strand:- start:570 stop:1073 length:504 start_codon:yes stop_codon:yes gene_type:complete